MYSKPLDLCAECAWLDTKVKKALGSRISPASLLETVAELQLSNNLTVEELGLLVHLLAIH